MLTALFTSNTTFVVCLWLFVNGEYGFAGCGGA